MVDTKDEIEKMKPLREQTRWLGSLLGQVLIEQEGKAFFELVEWVRKTSINYANLTVSRLKKN